MDCSPPDSSVNGDFPVENTGVGVHAFLLGIFLTQGLNLHLLHISPALQSNSFTHESPEKPYKVVTSPNIPRLLKNLLGSYKICSYKFCYKTCYSIVNPLFVHCQHRPFIILKLTNNNFPARDNATTPQMKTGISTVQKRRQDKVSLVRACSFKSRIYG